MSVQSYEDDVLRGEWDDTTRTVTEWDEDGQLIGTRPYTDDENDAADARALAGKESA